MSNEEDEGFLNGDTEGRFDCDLTYQPIVIEKQAKSLNRLLEKTDPKDD